MTADELGRKRLARLRMAYARAVGNHGEQSKIARDARAEYLIERIRLDIGPQVTGWADELDIEHRAALADALRDVADRIDTPD